MFFTLVYWNVLLSKWDCGPVLGAPERSMTRSGEADNGCPSMRAADAVAEVQSSDACSFASVDHREDHTLPLTSLQSPLQCYR